MINRAKIRITGTSTSLQRATKILNKCGYTVQVFGNVLVCYVMADHFRWIMHELHFHKEQT